jgi:hypothetical protein
MSNELLVGLRIAVYGDRDKLKELEKALPELTYETVSGDQAQVFHSIRELENHFGFLAIHASRNYGADSPLWGCAVTRRRFPVGASPTRRFAPAGSNRSSHGGNEMAEAFD